MDTNNFSQDCNYLNLNIKLIHLYIKNISIN